MTFDLNSNRRCKADRNAIAHAMGSIRGLYLVPFAPFLLLLPNAADANTVSRSDDAVASEHVRIDDLNLQSPAGWRTAKLRVSRAAARVCAAQLTFTAAARCRGESVARAEHEIARYADTHQASLANVPTSISKDAA